MKSDDVFPSKYLKASDLQGREAQVVIDRVVREDGIDKPVMYFQGKEKGLVVNKTNWNRVAYLYGDESDDWAGREIILAAELVEYQGKTVEGTRVRPPAKRNSNGNIKTEQREGYAISSATAPVRKTGGISDTLPDDIAF